MKELTHFWITGVCLIAVILFSCTSGLNPGDSKGINKNSNKRIDSLISIMTLEEKLGQLNLVVGDLFNSGPTVMTRESNKFDSLIRKGEITGIFNIHGAKYIDRIQRIAVEESRLGIPLLIGADIIHGFKTVFPIPLGEAASWDLEAIEESAKYAALESSAAGINWTFAPMVDISRDARWGRVAEGAGEDPFLGSEIAKARVRGFQGSDLKDERTIAACIKHFAAYGAPVAGREYNTVDMSEIQLRNQYLPPYEAGISEGAASVMTSFNELNGIPCTGSDWLLQDILRKEWGFDGMVVSDWQSITEMVDHGYSENAEHSAIQSLSAGCDMDMMSSAYLESIPNAIEHNKIAMEVIDEAVKNVLTLKDRIGLFDNPYKYSSSEREATEIRTSEARQSARDMAKKSICLLKNQGNILPLKKSNLSIALIGPFARNQAEHNGTWSFFGEPKDVVTLEQGILNKDIAVDVDVAEGCLLFERKEALLKEAISLSRRSDVIIACLGEAAVMNGEAGSRSNIGLPDHQKELLNELKKLGKPIVLVLTHGRPMDLSWEDKNLNAILASWTLGSESGNAIADVLFGDYNPSGRLPITFPRNVGQVPIYYNVKNTGRPYKGDYTELVSDRTYSSKYRDVKNSPLYPFGYGLSYTQFNYGDIKVNKQKFGMEDKLNVSIQVQNIGERGGEECVQLYIKDLVASITRPIKELKGFQKIYLEPGESKNISFELSSKDFGFYNAKNEFVTEMGTYQVMIGSNSESLKIKEVELKD